MRNQKGITLIEILAAVVVLGIAVVSITFVLQQTTLFSKQNADSDRSIQITRTVLEEIKNKMKTADTIQVYDQTVHLTPIKQSAGAASLPALYYPNPAKPQYRLDVSSLPITNGQFSSPKGTTVNIADYFRHIQITTTHLSDNRVYRIDTYAEVQ